MTKRAIILSVLGVVIGAILGYTYNMEIGCLNGTCAITSKPLNSVLYGGLMGGLLFNMFLKSTEK